MKAESAIDNLSRLFEASKPNFTSMVAGLVQAPAALVDEAGLAFWDCHCDISETFYNNYV